MQDTTKRDCGDRLRRIEGQVRGIARMMLAAGIAHLRSRGATSITLGVDAHDPAPFQLYRSVGFEISTSQEAWDKQL